MSKLFIIDDDAAIAPLADGLYFQGYEIQRVTSATEALARLDEVLSCDLVVLDVLMDVPDSYSGVVDRSIHGGMVIFREIRSRTDEMPILVYTAQLDPTISGIIEADPHARYVSKYSSPTLAEMREAVSSLLGQAVEPLPPVVFIVHGHNEEVKLEVKNYLQNTLHLTEPTILHEKPNLGRTIIEKFEDYAYASNLVFVLLTPDDLWADASEDDDAKRRARQNVIFEMGFFLGNLGRESGRVILLHHGPIDLPSDLAGVVYIDISGGVGAAGEDIRREIAHVIK